MEDSFKKLKSLLLHILFKYGEFPGYDLPYFHLNYRLETVCSHATNNFNDESNNNEISWNHSIFFSKNICACTSSHRKQLKLKKNFSSSKTIWPVAVIDRIFLPQFQIRRFFADNNFTILNEISKGAFGKVYKVKNSETKNVYAIKILRKAQLIAENAVRQVRDEVTIQKLCGHHQFIVSCMFSWQTHCFLFIVLEYKSGGDLFDLLEEYAFLTEDLVKLYVAEIALAIDFLHGAGVIYRDLKPENLLLDEQNHISLTDFGLSKWLSIGSRTNTICGTSQYMAPEISRGEPYSHAVDWWSLGVLTCRLLTDEYPQRNGMKILLPDMVPVNVGAKDLLFRLLTYHPSRRLRSLHSLKTIIFFKDYSFNSVIEKKVNPRELLRKCPIRKQQNLNNKFPDFDTES